MLSLNPYDLDSAINLARTLVELDASRITTQVRAVLDVPVIAGEYAQAINETENHPAYFDFVSGNVGVLLLGGVTNVRTVARINNCWYAPPNENPGFGENVWLAILADNMGRATLASNLPLGSSLWVAGYSGGAAIAGILAAAIQGLRPDLRVCCVMFNPPRPAVAAWGTRAPAVSAFRFHNAEDPVAHLPLLTGEGVVVNLAMLPGRQGFADRYTHIGMGLSLDVAIGPLHLSIGHAPPIGDIGVVNQLGWATGLDDRQVLAHSLAVLITRMSQFRLSIVGAVGDAALLGNPFLRTSGGVMERVPNDPGPPVLAHDDVVLQAGIRLAGGAPQVDPLTLTITFPQPGQYKPYWKGRSNGVWYVWYQATPLFAVSSKSVAKRHVSRLNSILNALLADVNNDVESLGASLVLEVTGGGG